MIGYAVASPIPVPGNWLYKMQALEKQEKPVGGGRNSNPEPLSRTKSTLRPSAGR